MTTLPDEISAYYRGFDEGVAAAKDVTDRRLTVADHIVLTLIWSVNGAVWTCVVLTVSGHLR